MAPRATSPTSTQPATSSRHTRDIRLVALLTLSTSLLSLLLLHVFAWLIPPFDSSHLLASASYSPTLRWDAVHFLSVARRGYEWEQHLAFQPGWHGSLRAAGEAVAFTRRVLGYSGGVGDGDAVVGGVLLSIGARVVANVYLYKLTSTLFTRRTALITCILYALPPTPAVLVSPYTEPLFAAFSFTASYAAIHGRYLLAAALFAGATSMRATGVLGAAVLGWMMLVAETKQAALIRDGEWVRAARRLPAAIAYALIVAAPFLAFQVYAYASFCLPPTRPWCARRLPLAYSFVQDEYWNIGPFRYWTPAQLPNFALAAPVVIASLYGVGKYLTRTWRQLCAGVIPTDRVTPFYLHHAAMLLLLLVASHTQIALRVAVTEPIVWWTVAGFVTERREAGEVLKAEVTVGAAERQDAGKTPDPPTAAVDSAGSVEATEQIGRLGRWWIGWTVVWGAVSLVLWAGHYPPA